MERLPGVDEIGNACIKVAEELAGQPELFDATLLPIDIPVLRSAKTFARTGKIACKDDATAMAVAVCKLGGLSDRETSRRTGVTASTVPAIMRALEVSGRIPSAHRRLATSLVELAGASAQEMQRIIVDADGNWSPQSAAAIRSLSILMGVAVDKSQLLTGQATQIVEQRASVDHAADWERKLRQVFPADNVDISPAPPDPQSGAVISNYLAPNTSTELGTPESTPNRDFLVNDRRPEPLEVALLGAGGVELSRGGGSGDAFP